MPGEDTKLVHNRQEIVPRHGSLRDDLNAFLGGTGHGRSHQLGRDLLGLNQDLAFGKIGRRPKESYGDTDQ